MKTFDIDRLRRLALEKPIISFDVFDTLLVRTSSDPLAAFQLVEKVHGFRGFVRLRKSAELEARRHAQERGLEDTHLRDIYNIMVQVGGPNYAEASAVECEVEKALLRPNLELCELLREFKAAGKRILAVSDMYHDKTFVSELLQREGLPVDSVYVSSETGKLKYTGNMFLHVLQDQGVDASKLLHIGDNWHADIRGARSVGISAVLYPKIRVQAGASPLIPGKLLAAKPEETYASQCAGLACVRWLREGKPTSKRDLHWWIGYTVLGPLSRLFVEWLHRQAVRDQVEELYFLRRDGELWQKMFESLYPDIGSKLLYGNRKLLQDADLEKLLDEDSFPKDHAIAFRISYGDSITTIAENFGFSDELITAIQRQLVATGRWEGAETSDRGRLLLEFIKQNPDSWRHYAQTRRTALEKYYQHEGVTGERRAKIALVDIGWRLSSFRALHSVLGFQPRAYFMGIASGAYFGKELCGFLFEYGAPDEAYKMYRPHFIEVLETLFGGTEPSAVSISERQDIVKDEMDESERIRIDTIRSMYLGAMEFARDSKTTVNYLAAITEDELPDTARSMVQNIVNNPDPEFFETVSSLQFSAYAGKALSTRKPVGEAWRRALKTVQTDEAANNSDNQAALSPTLLATWSQAYTRSLIPYRLFRFVSRYRLANAVRIIEQSGLLDDDWYTGEYLSAADFDISPAEHYVRLGVFQGCEPSTAFNSFAYLQNNPDVAQAGMNPLVHYILHGQHELREQQ